MADFSDMTGLTLKEIKTIEDCGDILEIHFFTECGRTFKQLHIDNCCEWVSVEDICGDLDDLIGLPLLLCEEVQFDNMQTPEGVEPTNDESFTWTFYKLATNKGAVTIRWYGSSNGYYSESVSFMETTTETRH